MQSRADTIQPPPRCGPSTVHRGRVLACRGYDPYSGRGWECPGCHRAYPPAVYGCMTVGCPNPTTCYGALVAPSVVAPPRAAAASAQPAAGGSEVPLNVSAAAVEGSQPHRQQPRKAPSVATSGPRLRPVATATASPRYDPYSGSPWKCTGCGGVYPPALDKCNNVTCPKPTTCYGT